MGISLSPDLSPISERISEILNNLYPGNYWPLPNSSFTLFIFTLLSISCHFILLFYLCLHQWENVLPLFSGKKEVTIAFFVPVTQMYISILFSPVNDIEDDDGSYYCSECLFIITLIFHNDLWRRMLLYLL